MFALVYTHTFSNGATYFGNATNSKRPYSFVRGKRYNSLVLLYGNPDVRIIASGLSIAEADSMEQSLFDEYVRQGGVKLQNRPSGGDLQRQIDRCSKADPTVWTGLKRSKESREKMSVARIGMTNGMTGKSHSDVTKAKISKANKGKKRTFEQRQYMSMMRKGVPLGKQSDEHRLANQAAQCRPEVRQKRSASLKGRQTKAHRRVQSSLDGRLTIAACIGKLNKSNPNYVGTWVDVIEEVNNG